MTDKRIHLPPEVAAAADRGHTIEATRLLRELTGADLDEARDAVEAWMEQRDSAEVPPEEREFPLAAEAALRRGSLIGAARIVAEQYRLGPYESGEMVREHLALHPGLRKAYESAFGRFRLKIVGIAMVVLVMVALLYQYLEAAS